MIKKWLGRKLWLLVQPHYITFIGTALTQSPQTVHEVIAKHTKAKPRTKRK